MSTRHFKKKTLLKKHNKSRLTKRINKLSGGAFYTDDNIENFMTKIFPILEKQDNIDYYKNAAEMLKKYIKNKNNKSELLKKASISLDMVNQEILSWQIDASIRRRTTNPPLIHFPISSQTKKSPAKPTIRRTSN